MRTSIRNPIALALAAALAGCAGGGGHTDEVNGYPAIVCIALAYLPCLLPHPKQTAASGTSSGSSSASSALGGAGVPQPQPLTQWEGVTAPGATADAQFIRPFQYYRAADGSFKADGADNPLPSTATINIADSGALVSVGITGTNRLLEFDGRTLPGSAGILFGKSRALNEASATPFDSLAHVDLTDDATHWAYVGATADPYRQGWSYQSFGVWDSLSSGVNARMYASSFGTPTQASALPMTGAATFTGKLAGSYVSAANEGSLAAADVSVAVDFATRSLSVTSTGTTITRDLSTATPAPGLDLKGTLTYSAGSASFSGTLTNAAGSMNGDSSGRFYGPAAEELGGMFALKSATTPESMVGAYGAKR